MDSRRDAADGSDAAVAGAVRLQVVRGRAAAASEMAISTFLRGSRLARRGQQPPGGADLVGIERRRDEQDEALDAGLGQALPRG